jgi:uncharacterized protein
VVNVEKDHLVQDLKERIVNQVKPEGIILFGSVAQGVDNPDSDIDVLVIWDEEPDLSNRDRRLKLRRLIGDFNSPMDLLTYTSEELKKALSEPNSFTSQIVKEGRVIYGRLQ